MTLNGLWHVVVVGTILLLANNFSSASGALDADCPYFARSSDDLQEFLNTSVPSRCDTIILLAQEYTLAPFELKSGSRRVTGQSSATSVIRYQVSRGVSNVDSGANLEFSKVTIVSDGTVGNFLSIGPSHCSLVLEDAVLTNFTLRESAIITTTGLSNAVIQRTTFLNNLCAGPWLCKAGVLEIASSALSELYDVSFVGFKSLRKFVSGGSDSYWTSGLTLNGIAGSNSTLKTSNLLFENNLGTPLVATGFSIVAVDESATWTFKRTSNASNCAHLTNVDANISWLIIDNSIDYTAISLDKSNLSAKTITIRGTWCGRDETPTATISSLLELDSSKIITDSITINGTGSLHPSKIEFSGIRLTESEISAQTILASHLYAGVHAIVSTRGDIVFEVSGEISLEDNAGGILIEVPEKETSRLLPLKINARKLSIVRNGIVSITESEPLGGIFMTQSSAKKADASILDIQAQEILFQDNLGINGGAISYSTPFSMKATSIKFVHNKAKNSGGVYYSSNPHSDYIPQELFQSTTFYDSNSAPQGCVIGFVNSATCQAYRPFQASFTENMNETMYTQSPSCPMSDQHCTSSEYRCGLKPSFGIRSLWRFDELCALSYVGDLEIPAGSVITKKFVVKGLLTFTPTDPKDPRSPPHSLIFQPDQYIFSDNRGQPLILPLLPVSYYFSDLDVKYVAISLIRTQYGSISPSPLPNVDLFVVGNPKGVRAICSSPISPKNGILKEFGVRDCYLEYPKKRTPTWVIIVIVSGTAVAASMVIAIVAYTIWKVKRKTTSAELEGLLSETEYIY